MAEFFLTTKHDKSNIPIAIDMKDPDNIVKLTEKKHETQSLEPLEFISEKDIRQNKYHVQHKQLSRLKTALETNVEPEGDLKQLYDTLREKLLYNINKKISSFTADYMLLPNPKRCNRIYCAGSTGVGKSYWIKQYVAQIQKIYPKRKVFLFSDVQNDVQLNSLANVSQVALNMSLVEKPIQTMELEDSVCIFDDIDSISNIKIKKAIYTLYDAILKKGSSKDNIELIISNHAMSDYRETRNILINCNYVVFFPQSAIGLQYTLKKFGLSKQQIEKLMTVPSRWVCLHKNFPFYYISSNTVELI